MINKKCFKCGEVKPLAEFYKHARMNDGHLNKCKACSDKYSKEYIIKNREAIRKNKVEYNARPENIAKRKAYYSTAVGKGSRETTRMRYSEKYPERVAAHKAVKEAMRTGALTRPSHCSCCGAECTPQAHHESYEPTSWLVVDWLCINCHIDAHNALRQLEREVM